MVRAAAAGAAAVAEPGRASESLKKAVIAVVPLIVSSKSILCIALLIVTKHSLYARSKSSGCAAIVFFSVFSIESRTKYEHESPSEPWPSKTPKSRFDCAPLNFSTTLNESWFALYRSSG